MYRVTLSRVFFSLRIDFLKNTKIKPSKYMNVT